MHNLDDAIQAIKTGNQKQGHLLLKEILQNEQLNERAWLWLSTINDAQDCREMYLQNVLALNPRNRIAKEGLGALAAGTFNSEDFMEAIETGKYNKGNDYLMTLAVSILVPILCGLVVFSMFAGNEINSISNNLNLNEINNQITYLISRVLLLLMIAVLFVFIIVRLLNPVHRRHAYEELKASFRFSLSNSPRLLIGASFFAVFGLLALFQANSLQIASLVLLIAWLLSSEVLYPNDAKGESLRAKPITFFLKLAFWYFLAWVGFILALRFRGSVSGTIYIYSVGVLFLLGIKIVLNDILKARLADDLFLIIVLFAGFIFIKTLRSPSESASATVLATIGNYALLKYGQNLINVVTILNNIAVIEYYIYCTIILLLLGSIKDIPRPPRKIPSGFFWVALNILGIIFIWYAIGQVLTGFHLFDQEAQSTLLMSNTTINLVIAMIGVFVLILSNDQSSTDMFEEQNSNMVRKSIHINVPPHKVMYALQDINEAINWSPGLKVVSNAPDYLAKDSTYEYEFSLELEALEKLNVPTIQGKTTITELTDDYFVMKTVGKVDKPLVRKFLIHSTWEWKLTPKSDGTEVVVIVKYAPGWILRKIGDIEGQAKQTLENLKIWLEEGPMSLNQGGVLVT